MNLEFLVAARNDLVGSYQFIQHYFSLSTLEKRSTCGWVFLCLFTAAITAAFILLFPNGTEAAVVTKYGLRVFFLLFAWILAAFRRFRYHVVIAFVFTILSIWRRMKPPVTRERQYTFLNEHFSFGGDGQYQWNYHSITDIIDTGSHYLVFMGPGRGIFFRKTDFVIGSPDQFEPFLEQKTARPIRRTRRPIKI